MFLRDLLEGCEKRWGDPQKNIGKVVPFGICVVDDNLLGVPITSGGIIGIQGVPGSRKTTLLINIIINQCISGKLPPGYSIAIDTLETGMTIERYADVMVSILATKMIVYWHWNQTDEDDPVKLFSAGIPTMDFQDQVENVGMSYNGGKFSRETVIRPEFLKLGLRTKRQHRAIRLAREIMSTWPVMIFGSSEHPDREIAIQRSTDTTNLVESFERWKKLSQEEGMKELTVDHIGEYVFSDNPSSYELQRRVVRAMAVWQKSAGGVGWAIVQIGVTAEREARQSGVKAYAAGGKALEAQAQLMWQVEYDEENPYAMKLKRPIKSRIGMHNTVAIPLDPMSGAFIGRAQEFRKLEVKW
jgi:hypothetical protein